MLGDQAEELARIRRMVESDLSHLRCAGHPEPVSGTRDPRTHPSLVLIDAAWRIDHGVREIIELVRVMLTPGGPIIGGPCYGSTLNGLSALRAVAEALADVPTTAEVIANRLSALIEDGQRALNIVTPPLFLPDQVCDECGQATLVSVRGRVVCIADVVGAAGGQDA